MQDQAVDSVASLDSALTSFCDHNYIRDTNTLSTVGTDECTAASEYFSSGPLFGLLNLFQLALGAIGSDDLAGCANAQLVKLGNASIFIMVMIFLIISMVLMLNMLIAMMAKTFDSVRRPRARPRCKG